MVAVREITEDRILFFTQVRTPKVAEIKNNNCVTLTFWFERHAREVIVEGAAEFLSAEQNAQFWASYSQWAQIRFCSYAPTSRGPIADKQLLEDKRMELQQHWNDDILCLAPLTIVVLQLKLNDLCSIVIGQMNYPMYGNI